MASPSPCHILRNHSSQISALFFSPCNTRIYSGDSTGKVVAVLTNTLRPLANWRAHEESVLGIEEWAGRLITHGRDNKIHVWRLPPSLPAIIHAAADGAEPPELLYSLDVNALNYCRFSLLQTRGNGCTESALIAVPNLVESYLVDVWEIPSRDRIHAAIGPTSLARNDESVVESDGRNKAKTGIAMSIHLYSHGEQLRVIVGYESGKVILYASRTPLAQSTQGHGWETLWTSKIHNETVMHLEVSPDALFALTVSADHIVGKYSLEDDTPTDSRATVYRTKHPGNSAIAIRSDSRVCAIAGWDGRIRLYSTKTFKPLGTLDYHRDSVYAVAFANMHATWRAQADEFEDAEKEKMTRWLVVGGKDTRLSIWELISFLRS